MHRHNECRTKIDSKYNTKICKLDFTYLDVFVYFDLIIIITVDS